ncbi:MAG TPA: hypothetical protein VFZ24_12425 [Longimicrobiales bacterium]
MHVREKSVHVRVVAGALLVPMLIAADASSQAQDRALAVQAEDVYRVGGVDAPAWAAFAEVDAVGFGPQGELWIVDGRGIQIVRVAPDGRSGVNHMKHGRGPGEFQRPTGLAVLGDGRLLVGDAVNRNLQLLGRDGGLITGVRADRTLRAAGFAWLEREQFVAVPEIFFIDGGQAVFWGPEGMTPATRVPLLRFALGEELDVRTIATATYTQPPRNTVPFASHAFGPDIHWSSHRGHIAVVDGVDYDIRVLDANGRQLMRVRRPVNPRSPSRADRTAAREEARSRLIAPNGMPRVVGAVQGGGSGQTRDARVVLGQIEAGLDAMTFARRIPVVIGLSHDDAGRIWVARTPDVWGRSPILDVFSPAGEYLGTTSALPRLPDAFGPGGLAAFIEKDELDVAYVRVIRLELNEQ